MPGVSQRREETSENRLCKAGRQKAEEENIAPAFNECKGRFAERGNRTDVCVIGKAPQKCRAGENYRRIDLNFAHTPLPQTGKSPLHYNAQVSHHNVTSAIFTSL